MVFFGEHRLALMEARVTSAKMLEIHREVLNRQRQVNRYQLGIACRTLQRERERTAHALHEYQRVYELAKIQAQEYRLIWAQTKKEGAKLLQFVERHPWMLQLVSGRLKRAA